MASPAEHPTSAQQASASQASAQKTPAPAQLNQETGDEPNSVQMRVSELLDNVTVIEEETEQETLHPDAELAAGATPPNGEGQVAAGQVAALQSGLSHAPGQGEGAMQAVSDAPGSLNGAADGDTAHEANLNGTNLDGSNPDEDDSVSASALKIRGRPGGVSIEMGDGDWGDLLTLLDKRLSAAEGFFRGGRAVVELGPRAAAEDELRQVRTMLARHDMTLSVVQSVSPRTLQSALRLGLSTSGDGEATAPAPEPAMAAVVPITQPQSPYFVHNGTLRSGQVLRKSESVVVLGDVNPGAQVISAGDVMVWGRLRGVAHAGASGNKKAVVAAIEFAPTQLRIAGVTAVAPDAKKSGRGLKFWKKPPDRRPEVAYIADGRIVVEPWDDSRPGRPKTSRR